MAKHIITATVLNETGVLNRITGVMARCRYNIESICVGYTEMPNISRITFVINVDNVEHVLKQLHRQINVLKVTDITNQPAVTRELALIRVSVNTNNRQEIYSLIEPFRATVVDVGHDSVVIQVTGTSEKLTALLDLLRPYGLLEVARSGVITCKRSTKKAGGNQGNQQSLML